VTGIDRISAEVIRGGLVLPLFSATLVISVPATNSSVRAGSNGGSKYTGEAMTSPGGAAARSGETVIANDVAADARYLTTSVATRSEMIVPVIDRATREVLGTIDVASHRENAFASDDRELIEDCAQAILALWMESK